MLGFREINPPPLSYSNFCNECDVKIMKIPGKPSLFSFVKKLANSLKWPQDARWLFKTGV